MLQLMMRNPPPIQSGKLIPLYIKSGSVWVQQPVPTCPPPACAYTWVGSKSAGLEGTDWGSGISLLLSCPLLALCLAQQCWMIHRCLRKGQWGLQKCLPFICDVLQLLHHDPCGAPCVRATLSVPVSSPHLKVARKGAAWNGLLMLERCFWAHAREVWGKETARRRPWTRRIVLWRVCRASKATGWVSTGVLAVKVGLKCTIARSPGSYFVFANLKNKISYLFSLTRADREQSSFSRVSLGPAFFLASISKGKSWGYSQLQKISPFSQLIKIKLLLVEKMLKNPELRWENFFFVLKRNHNKIFLQRTSFTLSSCPHSSNHQEVYHMEEKKTKTNPPIFCLIEGLLLYNFENSAFQETP